MKLAIWRIVWLLLFLLGATFSLLYVHGFRVNFDSRSAEDILIPTGILDISTAPSDALVFVDENLLGTSDVIIRGYPLGEASVRLEKSGFLPLEFSVDVQQDLVTFVRSAVLIPRDIREAKRNIAHQDLLFWDPKKRGYVIWDPSAKLLTSRNIARQTTDIRELTFAPDRIQFSADGQLQMFQESEMVFSEDMFDTGFFSPSIGSDASGAFSDDNKYRFSVAENVVNVDSVDNSRASRQLGLDAPIEGVWWMRGSPNLIIVSRDSVVVWLVERGIEQVFDNSDTFDTPMFFADHNLLFYKSDKIWKSIKIGSDTAFSSEG